MDAVAFDCSRSPISDIVNLSSVFKFGRIDGSSFLAHDFLYASIQTLRSAVKYIKFTNNGVWSITLSRQRERTKKKKKIETDDCVIEVNLTTKITYNNRNNNQNVVSSFILINKNHNNNKTNILFQINLFPFRFTLTKMMRR